MAYESLYKANTNVMNPFGVQKNGPLDVRSVVSYISDLKEGLFLKTAYEGMVVYVVEDSSLYVCFYKPRTNKLNSVEDGWRKVDIDYSVRIVEFESNLTDGETILFPFQGMMAYVTSESSLYILLTKGVEKAKDISNWKKITAGTQIDKVGIDTSPEGGSGFMITENKGVIIDDYVNVENYIKADYFYISKGVNSFDTDYSFAYDSVRLSKGGESYIELYANGDNWIMINDPDNTLGLSINIIEKEYVSGEPISKDTPVCFGVDIKFNEGWTISYGDESRLFVDSDYELIDIYRSEYSPEVYAYLKNIDVRILTEDDLVAIDDKIEDMANSIMIDIDDSDSDDSELVPLQQVLVQMKNSINKLEQTTIEPDPIESSDIDQLFS